jgi:biuret amidohydrolase
MNIAAQPFDFELDFARCALVIIDMQRDFVEPGGFGETLGNDVALLQAIVPACQAVLHAWRRAGGLVVHAWPVGSPTLRIGDEGPMGRILIAGEPGNQIIEALAPRPGEIALDKPGKGAFYATPLHNLLQQAGVTQLVFMGVTTEVCVQTSMREANDRGYDALLLEDCTESYFARFKSATLEMIRAQGGIVGWTASSAALLAALPTP